jgi:hypothetical protein
VPTRTNPKQASENRAKDNPFAEKAIGLTMGQMESVAIAARGAVRRSFHEGGHFSDHLPRTVPPAVAAAALEAVYGIGVEHLSDWLGVVAALVERFPPTDGEQPYLFLGTSADAAEDILSGGIQGDAASLARRPPLGTSSVAGAWAVESLKELKARGLRGGPCILAIPTSSVEGGLHPHLPSIDYPIGFHRREIPGARTDWRKCLASAGAVTYDGMLPIQEMVAVYRVADIGRLPAVPTPDPLGIPTAA